MDLSFDWWLPLSVAIVARSRKRTNKHSNYSCINRPRDMALHTYFSKRIWKNVTSMLGRDIIALAQTIWMARLDMQFISFWNATTQKIHAWIFPSSDCCRCQWRKLHIQHRITKRFLATIDNLFGCVIRTPTLCRSAAPLDENKVHTRIGKQSTPRRASCAMSTTTFPHSCVSAL
jgi:hypothetical protein